MKKSDTWMPLYIGDYLADTTHLTTEQHGAYLLLLMALWKRGGADFPDVDENLAAAARVPIPRWRSMRRVLIDGVLLRSDGAVVTQKRLSDERGRAAKITEARTESGAKGGAKAVANIVAKRQQTDRKEVANSQAKQQQTSTPSQLQEEIRDSDPGGSAVPARAMTAKERLWALGVPLLGDGARALLGKLAKAHGEELLAKVLAEATLERPVDAKAWVIAACEAKAKTRPVSGVAPGGYASGTNVQALLDREPRPQWVRDAGFDDIWAAENDGCFEHNAAQFHNGKRTIGR